MWWCYTEGRAMWLSIQTLHLFQGLPVVHRPYHIWLQGLFWLHLPGLSTLIFFTLVPLASGWLANTLLSLDVPFSLSQTLFPWWPRSNSSASLDLCLNIVLHVSLSPATANLLSLLYFFAKHSSLLNNSFFICASYLLSVYSSWTTACVRTGSHFFSFNRFILILGPVPRA